MSTFDAGDRAVAGHAQPGAEPIPFPRAYTSKLVDGQLVPVEIRRPENRCPATLVDRGAHAFIAANSGGSPLIRCRELEGHEGKHKGSYQPFPGFADEYREWGDVS